MEALVYFIYFFAFFILFLIMWYSLYKNRSNKKLFRLPFISFVVPAFNEESRIERSIRSIYDSYDPRKCELIVVEDCSTDSTLKILKKLQREYKFNLIVNESNQGRPISLNKGFKNSKGKIVFFVDADGVINKTAVMDCLAKLESNDVAAATCRPIGDGKGFLSYMQNIEYGLSSGLSVSYNPFSTMIIWGSCYCIKREVFEKVGMLKSNLLGEDGDLAFNIRSLGLRVEECSSGVHTHTMNTWKAIRKQKIRWVAGSVQNILGNFKFFINHPINLLFIFLFLSIIILSTLISFENVSLVTSLIYKQITLSSVSIFILTAGISMLVLPLFTIHSIILNFDDWREKKSRFLLVYPFVFIYSPIITIIGIYGVIYGVYKYYTKDRLNRAW